MFAVVLALCVFGFNIALGEVYVSIQRREAGIKRNIEMLSYTSALRARVERELNALLFLSSGLGSYLVVRNDSIQDKEVSDILSVLYRSSQHVRNFGVAIGYHLRYVYPLQGNEKAVGLNYRDVPAQWPMIEKIISSGKPALAGPINLVQGGQGFIYRAPLFIGGKYWGLLSTVIDADSLFKAVFEQTVNVNFIFALRSEDIMGVKGQAILGDQNLFGRIGTVSQEIQIPGGRWTIAVQDSRDDFFLSVSTVVRFTSLFLGGLIAWLLYVLVRNRTELARLAMFDSLTGLPNRRLLEDRHMMIMARLQRDPKQGSALLFLDLDGFKKINDTHGHKAGDAILKETAQRARSLVRSSDTVARWGGDEFVVLFESVSKVDLDMLVVRLRQLIETPIEFEGQKLTVGASIGTAVYRNSDVMLETLLKTADEQMYQDKMRRKSTACT